MQVCPQLQERLDSAWNDLQARIVVRDPGISQIDCDEVCTEILLRAMMDQAKFWQYGRVDPNKLSENVVENVHQSFEEDPRTMERLEAMTPMDIFKRYLEWEGIIGYHGQIVKSVESIREAGKCQ